MSTGDFTDNSNNLYPDNRDLYHDGSTEHHEPYLTDDNYELRRGYVSIEDSDRYLGEADDDKYTGLPVASYGLQSHGPNGPNPLERFQTEMGPYNEHSFTFRNPDSPPHEVQNRKDSKRGGTSSGSTTGKSKTSSGSKNKADDKSTNKSDFARHRSQTMENEEDMDLYFPPQGEGERSRGSKDKHNKEDKRRGYKKHEKEEKHEYREKKEKHEHREKEDKKDKKKDKKKESHR